MERHKDRRSGAPEYMRMGEFLGRKKDCKKALTHAANLATRLRGI